jgi:magnesium transporter
MLNVLRRSDGILRTETVGPDWALDPDVVWVDLVRPTREEELAVEAALGLDLPTLAEMVEIEPSSRFYQEDGATFMTATLLARSEQDAPENAPATFVLGKRVLVTLRYTELKAFTLFAERTAQNPVQSAPAALFGLMDAIVQRLADTLEALGARVEDVSQAIFNRPAAGDFRPLLTGLARAQSVTALTRNSLVSLSRLLSFAGLAGEITEDPECKSHLESLHADTGSLTEHASYLSSQVTFLLDAALGLINIEQNGIIKFFSVVAVAFMPPTLVASIYGMNFHMIPELGWRLGYPWALLLMLISGVAPVLWFKRRGWL